MEGLDAVAGDVADDRGHPGGAEPEHVVEVAGHEAGAGLVDLPELEARRWSGSVLGGQARGPAPGGQLLLGEHLLGPPLELPAGLGDRAWRVKPLPSTSVATAGTRTSAEDEQSARVVDQATTSGPRATTAKERGAQVLAEVARDSLAASVGAVVGPQPHRRCAAAGGAERPQTTAPTTQSSGDERQERCLHIDATIVPGPGSGRW